MNTAGDRHLLAKDVAALFHVDPATVTRWARHGKIPCIVTPGGRRRYLESQIMALIKHQAIRDDLQD